ncbi:hypothetical protein [Clostridium sp. JS66]|uniref:hypothetical protein n=1 Tax=Clostridium sp. JS66 TaxID=3064705 RepID=UPI00298E8701|nr:hypothetical protein [Clostridium sp. JS66]WPC43284.1 hypothetical protein Q6H37_07375 [Clostridium sp. JS66]
MKILLIGFFTRTYMPYLNKYEKLLKDQNIDYDILFFDRDTTSDKLLIERNEYTYCHMTTTSRLKKMLPVFRYKKILVNLIKKNKYDKLIIFTTMPAILIKSSLLNEYKGKYIYDYRDATYEHYSFFKKWVNDIINCSSLTVMSSRGFLNFLNDNKKIVFNHNISNISDRESLAEDLQRISTINIGFLGYVRYFDVNSVLIRGLKNDSKYTLTYIGVPFSDCDLKRYADEIGAQNVTVIGKYDNNNKARLYSNIHIINSMYSLNSSEVQYAIPNRLYDAALFKKPLMTTKGTYLSEVVKKYGLGFSVDPFNDDIKEVINDYIRNFDPEKFSIKCEKFLLEVFEDEKKVDKAIIYFLKN